MEIIEGFSKNELLELSWEKPVMAQLAVTKNCDQNCIFCFRACGSEAAYPELRLSEWQGIIKKCKNLGVRRLNFSGGESFVYLYFLPLLKWAKGEGFEVIVNTDGGFDIKEAAQYVDEFIFSVHGLGDIHNQVVRKKTGNAFTNAEANIAISVKAGVRTSINMVLVQINYHQIMEVFHYFNSRYKIYKFSPTIAIQSLEGRQYEDIALEAAEELTQDYLRVLKMIPQAQLQLKHGFQTIFYNNPVLYTSAPIPLPNCAAGKYKLIVEYDGSVFPCNFFKGPAFYCGNLLEEDEYQIWQQGKGFVRFRQLILDEQIPDQCKRCLKKAKCFSGCRAWSAKYRQGGFEYARDLRCELGHAFIRN